MTALGRLLDGAANRVVAWSARLAEPDRLAWVDALAAELEVVEGGPVARLAWALGALCIACRTRRSTVTRIWRSLPGPLRLSLLGLALGAALVVDIVWSNVIVPSHDSDSEYTAWYLALYAGLLVYFAGSGLLAACCGSSIAGSALTGAVTAVLSIGIALATFVVIDNLFLDVVMQQPDKASGFAHSGLASRRDYVNHGNLLAFAVALPVLGAVGAGCGALGGLLARRVARPGGADRPGPQTQS